MFQIRISEEIIYMIKSQNTNIGLNFSVAVGIDHIPELIEMAKENINRDQPGLIESGRVKLQLGDGRLGVPEFGPYKAIHVGAAAPVLPQALVDQLKVSIN